MEWLDWTGGRGVSRDRCNFTNINMFTYHHKRLVVIEKCTRKEIDLVVMSRDVKETN